MHNLGLQMPLLYFRKVNKPLKSINYLWFYHLGLFSILDILLMLIVWKARRFKKSVDKVKLCLESIKIPFSVSKTFVDASWLDGFGNSEADFLNSNGYLGVSYRGKELQNFWPF